MACLPPAGAPALLGGRRPVPGVVDHETPLSRQTVVAARRGWPPTWGSARTVLLAAHARVLAVLSSERDVVVAARDYGIYLGERHGDGTPATMTGVTRP